MSIVAVITILFIVLALGLPVAFSLGLAGAFGIWLVGGAQTCLWAFSPQRLGLRLVVMSF